MRLTHALTGATEYQSLTASVSVQTTDNDTPGVTIDPTSVSLQENPGAGGGKNRHVGSYTVVLDTALAANQTVVVGVTSSDAGAVGTTVGGGLPAASGALTFTASTWDTAQTVPVVAQQDDDGRDESVTMSHSITTGAAAAGNAGDAGDCGPGAFHAAPAEPSGRADAAGADEPGQPGPDVRGDAGVTGGVAVRPAEEGRRSLRYGWADRGDADGADAAVAIHAGSGGRR